MSMMVKHIWLRTDGVCLLALGQILQKMTDNNFKPVIQMFVVTGKYCQSIFMGSANERRRYTVMIDDV